MAVILDKIDLIDRRFPKSLLGYCRDDVDRLVAEAAETIGRQAEEKMALARTVEMLRRELGECRAREATLRDTLLTTQKIVEELKAGARREAERILADARDRARAMIGEAEERTAALGREVDALRRRKAALGARFRGMLLASLDLLEAEAREEGAEPEGGPAIGKDGGSTLVAFGPEGCLTGGGAA